MNPRRLRRYIDDLLRGRRPKPFRPDDFEAAQIRTAIDLQAARLGSDAPRQEFLTDLQRRLAAQQDGAAEPDAEVECDPQETSLSARRPPRRPRWRRRQSIEH